MLGHLALCLWAQRRLTIACDPARLENVRSQFPVVLDYLLSRLVYNLTKHPLLPTKAV